MKFIYKLFATLLVFSLASCSSNEHNDAHTNTKVFKVSLLNSNNKILYQVEGEEAVKKIDSILNGKRVMMKKILPVFDSKLIIEYGGHREEWLFVKPNYIKRDNKQDKTIYELSGKTEIIGLLERMQ